MELQIQSHPQRKKEMEEEAAEAKLPREGKEESTATTLALPITTSSSSPCSSPSHDFSFTISFQSPSTAKSPTSTRTRCGAFDLAPADDIFFHGHLLPLQLFSRATQPASPLVSRLDAAAGHPVQEKSTGDRTTTTTSSSSSSSTSSSAASSNGDAKEKTTKGKLLSSLFGGMGRWRKGTELAVEKDEEDEKKRKSRAFDAMSRLLRSAVEPLFSFRGGGGRGRRRGDDLRRRPYSFAGNPNAGARAAEDWRRRRGELSAPASMRTSPSNSGLLVAPVAPNGGVSSEESTMEELRSAIEAAIAHCKSSVAMKEDKCKC